jgi:hypothetical protein
MGIMKCKLLNAPDVELNEICEVLYGIHGELDLWPYVY